MKKQTHTLVLLCCFAIAVYSCNKYNNNYATTDHTAGMVKMRSWSGSASGYAMTDTVLLPDTTHVAWAAPFSRIITDTNFSVEKVNGFQVSVLGAKFNYAITDSVAKIVRFDTTLSGSAQSILTYYYSRDSMTYEFHQITGLSAAANQYYQVNEFLHTN